MIDDVEKQIYEVAFKFTFIEKAETLLKTPSTGIWLNFFAKKLP